MDESKYSIQETVFDICPVCKNGRVYNLKPKGMIGFAKSSKIECEKCCALFSEQGVREEEKTYKLDLSSSDKSNKYNGQTLKKSEWIRGESDLDICIRNNELPDYNIQGLPIILQAGEKSHYYAVTKMYEERAVRQHVGGSVRVMKGVWIRTGQAESHGELREIDSGSILLTNKRVIFDGNSKKIEYQLPKIISLTEFSDSFQIGVSNRKKAQIYAVQEPHKCVTYIQMAINLYKTEKGATKSRATSKPKAENEALKILNLRYAKGEISKEEYEQMKKDIGEY